MIQRLRRLQAPHRGATIVLRPDPDAGRGEQLAARAEMLARAERSILADARTRLRAAELEGPLLGITCETIASDRKAVPDHLRLSRPVGRYDCLVAKRREIRGVALGYPFVAALDFVRFTYVWCRHTLPPSEAGKSPANVRLERP